MRWLHLQGCYGEHTEIQQLDEYTLCLATAFKDCFKESFVGFREPVPSCYQLSQYKLFSPVYVNTSVKIFCYKKSLLSNSKASSIYSSSNLTHLIWSAILQRSPRGCQRNYLLPEVENRAEQRSLIIKAPFFWLCCNISVLCSNPGAYLMRNYITYMQCSNIVYLCFFLGKKGADPFSQRKSTVAVICDDDSFNELCVRGKGRVRKTNDR